MAASAAHLTGTLSTALRPSVFELVSQETFGHALRPAIFHVVKSLAEKYPSGKLPLLFRHFDELYLTFDTFVQWHYILTRGATLSEAFYGLERKILVDDNKLLRIRLSYALSVLLPYLLRKLDVAYKSKVVEPSAEGSNSQSPGQQDKLSKILTFYPYVKTAVSILNFCYFLSYAFGYSEWHNLIFRVLRMKLGYSSPERTKFVEEKTAEILQPSLWMDVRRLPILFLRSMGESVLFGVEIGSFFVQFLEWWYNDNSKERIVLTALPIPPAPKVSREAAVVAKDKGICPLCRQSFRNATALSTSGIVYCYGCIVPYLKQENRCPVTSLKTTIDHLVRIF